MTLYYTDVASRVHSFDRKHAFRAYDSDNMVVHIWIGTCQSAIPAVNDNISVAYISCNSSNQIFGENNLQVYVFCNTEQRVLSHLPQQTTEDQQLQA